MERYENEKVELVEETWCWWNERIREREGQGQVEEVDN